MKKHSSAKSVMTFLIAAVFGLWSSSAISVPNEATPAVAASAGQDAAVGTYSGVAQLGPGLTFRVLFTIHADGTTTSQDISDFGTASIPSADGPHVNSLAVGSWKHTTGRTIVGTLIFFRSAVGSSEVDSIGRLSITGTFDEGFQTGTADVIAEVFPCVPATLGCPDPALLPPPTAPLFGTITVMRILP